MTVEERLDALEARLAKLEKVHPKAALIPLWRGALRGAEVDLFDALVDAYPGGIERKELARLTGHKPKAVTDTVADLIDSHRIAEMDGDKVRLNEKLGHGD